MTTGFSYDVFLSFRGEDTRKSFTDHLYEALKQAGIRTFRDDDAMDRGKLLEPELKKAIRESAISIIVFSRDYASSKWCLDEVLTIMGEKERLFSKHEVVPVFYNVEPSDVRNQTGSFEEAFCGYDDMIEAEIDQQKKIEWSEKTKAWRASLRKAGSLTGLVLADGYEAEFVSKIVDVIRKKLNYKLLYIEEKLVGIENHVVAIESWLQDPSPDAAVTLCIHGMGGIGKTTISKCIYNSNYHEYDASCFLADIHETSNQPGGLLRLQTQLLSTISGSKNEEVIWNLDEGIVKVAKALCNKKVLLVLDDIATRQQLLALLGRQQFHPKSKVIVTTRHKWLCNVFNVHPKGTRKVEGLSLDMKMIKEMHLASIVSLDHTGKRTYEDFSGCRIDTNKEHFKVEAIEKMKNLLLLQLDYATFSGSYKKLPKKIRLLRWHGFPLKSIPSYVPLRKLVVLDLRYSKLTQVWDGLKVVGSLKILNLSYSLELVKTPDFNGLSSLESLLLEGCLSLTHVCESIRYLERLVLLDISGCRRLKNIPCLPRSLVSLNMNGCSSLGDLGQVQCFGSFSPSSLLVDVDVSNCNLFDYSFPEDWSNVFSLKCLNISENHITSLPGCVKSLPNLEELQAISCSRLQSVLDVPKSVTYLTTYGSRSLKIVQPPPNPSTMLVNGCLKLRAVDGCFKLESVKNVDRKVIRYLGLEFDKQNTYKEDDSVKVAYEFGIFSTYVYGKTLPCFSRYKEIGSTISFRVPSHPNGSRISGLNVCFTATNGCTKSGYCKIQVNNKTKVLVWIYNPTIEVICKEGSNFDFVWSSIWRTGNLLDDGDEIVVRIFAFLGGIVEECCINFVYDNDEEEEEMDEEKKDTHNNHMISWADKLQVEISDYVHIGKTYYFKIKGATDVPGIDGIHDQIVDWWGLRSDWRCRHISVSGR